MTTLHHANWRATEKPREGEFARPGETVWWCEIRAEDTGNYIWCDCAYGCNYCDACIGCARKFVFNWDAQEWNESAMRCEHSPTGWHETDELDEGL